MSSVSPVFKLRNAPIFGPARRSLATLALLLATFSAGATPRDAPDSFDHINASRQGGGMDLRAMDPYLFPAATAAAADAYSEMLRHMGTNADVMVFPVWVAGPATSVTNRRAPAKAAGGAGGIAVIFPDIGEPFRNVFMQIIGGIEEKAKGRVTSIAVGANVDVAELNGALRRQDTRVVIALGRQGVKVATALDGEIGVVVGGVLMAPDSEGRNLQVNSLSPDPALLFSRLKGMMPRAKRVFTVYDPRQNEWLMQLAKEGAQAQGLELVAYPAQDLRAAMLRYQEIIAAADSKQDALWLPQDSITVEESAVLPLVLQESWSNNLTVFSSSFGHVKRGVLFSLYPDNVELGRHLANSALGMLASGENDAAGVSPLREVLMAINLRTAKHLGLNTGRLQSFDMAFPEQ